MLYLINLHNKFTYVNHEGIVVSVCDNENAYKTYTTKQWYAFLGNVIRSVIGSSEGKFLIRVSNLIYENYFKYINWNKMPRFISIEIDDTFSKKGNKILIERREISATEYKPFGDIQIIDLEE